MGQRGIGQQRGVIRVTSAAAEVTGCASASRYLAIAVPAHPQLSAFAQHSCASSVRPGSRVSIGYLSASASSDLLATSLSSVVQRRLPVLLQPFQVGELVDDEHVTSRLRSRLSDRSWRDCRANPSRTCCISAVRLHRGYRRQMPSLITDAWNWRRGSGASGLIVGIALEQPLRDQRRRALRLRLSASS